MDIGDKQNEIYELGRTDSVDGFLTFYDIVHDQAPPELAEEWIETVYEAKKQDLGTLIEAFRHSTKTTTFTTFIAHQIGLYPHKANLLIQVSDESAKDNSQAIASIIEYNNGFKAFFPNIVPDIVKGWSASGYEVMDGSIKYEEWRRQNSHRKDPTLLGLGRTSHGIIGKHPNGVCLIDDIDDETSTSSDRERAKTRKILQGTIFPTFTPGETVSIVIGTPWTLDDTIAYVKATGDFLECFTPITKDGKPVWPEKFGEEVIAKLKKKFGEVEYARMCLLDLTAATGITLKKEWIHYYPHDEIDPNWTDWMGVDYASTSDRQKKDAKRDYFAMCWGKITPGRTLIVTDGYAGKISQQDSYQKLIAQVQLLPFLQQIGIEAIGKGEEFYELLRLAPIFLPLFPIPSHTGLARSKGGRFEKVLAPMFQRSNIMLSTKITPFLKEFVDEWTTWDSPHYLHDDRLDSVYMMSKAAEGHVAIPEMQVKSGHHWFRKKPKKVHPWGNLKNA